MKRIIALFGGITVLSLLALWSYCTLHPSGIAPALLSPGDEDDHRVFAEYEIERLRDPATQQIPPGIRERELAYTATLPSTSDFSFNAMRNTGLAESKLNLTNIQQYGIEKSGGRTRALAIDAANPSVLLAGAISGGVWRSTDEGATWKKMTKNTDGHSVSCIVQDKRKGKQHIWYYGTGEVLGTGGYPIYNYDIGEGIFTSNDSGKTWSKLVSTSVTKGKGPRSPFSLITQLAIDESKPAKDVIYCAGAGSIQRSDDGGETWTTVLGTATAFTASLTQVVVMPDGVVYATLGATSTTTGGFYRSADGINFTQLTTGNFGTFSRAVIAPSPSEPNTVWLLTHNGGMISLLRYTYRSGDGSGTGGVWYQAPNQSISSYINTLNGYCQAIAVHPTNPKTLLIGGQDLYITTDEGQSFTQIGGYQEGILQGRDYDPTRPVTYLHPNHHPDIHALVFHPANPNILYDGNDGGVYRTKNLSTTAVWESLNNGYKVGQFYSIDIDRKGIDKGAFIAGAQDNNAMVGRAGMSDIMKWVLSGDGMYCSMPSGGTTFFPAIQMGQVYRVDFNAQKDSVINWTNIAPAANFGFFARVEKGISNDSVMFILDKQALWANTNVFDIPVTKSRLQTRVNWSVLPVTSSVNMSVLGQCASDPNKMYIGTTAGRILRVTKLWDPDIDVTELRPSNLHPQGYVSCIHVDKQDADKLMVALSNYSIRSVFYSTDGGTTFTDVSGNLEPPVPDEFYAGPSVRWIESQRTPQGMIYYAGTSSGLFYTTELRGDQTQWIRIDEVGTVIVNMLKVRDSDGFVAVATHGLGVFTFNAKLSGASSVQRDVAEVFCSSAAPNPSSGDVRLLLSQPIESPHTLTVLDGRGIAVHKQTVVAGAGEVIHLSLSHLPGGVYFAVLNDPKRRTQFVPQKLIIQ
ncbi:MAG: hypothetical protein JNL32_02720 [Candidatus Kapabacteria bacterium]|nr:hypothetical protein [Candidatus Kapabacteria bacterium]